MIGCLSWTKGFYGFLSFTDWLPVFLAWLSKVLFSTSFQSIIHFYTPLILYALVKLSYPLFPFLGMLIFHHLCMTVLCLLQAAESKKLHWLFCNFLCPILQHVVSFPLIDPSKSIKLIFSHSELSLNTYVFIFL